jgi:hypothetical protein
MQPAVYVENLHHRMALHTFLQAGSSTDWLLGTGYLNMCVCSAHVVVLG